MLLIDCPWCGMRDEVEFRCGAEAHVVRPDPALATNDAWADYLFSHDNPKGWTHERWAHVRGCGQWFNALRHTVTHEIRVTYRIGAPPPKVPHGA